MLCLQVKKEKKNENLARYYRLQDEVRATKISDTVASRRCQLDADGRTSHICLVLQEVPGAENEAKEPTADSKTAAALEPARNTKQEGAVASEHIELRTKEQNRPKAPKASSTRGQKSTPQLAPPSESDAEPESEEEEEEEEDKAEAEASKRWARMRGLAGTESSSEDGDGSDSETDAELPVEVDDGEVKHFLRVSNVLQAPALSVLAQLCEQPFKRSAAAQY